MTVPIPPLLHLHHNIDPAIFLAALDRVVFLNRKFLAVADVRDLVVAFDRGGLMRA